MKHLFVSYEMANQLKDKGFDQIDCFGSWHIETKQINQVMPRWASNSEFMIAPLYQQVVDWLREKHNLHIIITSLNDHEIYGKDKWEYDITNINSTAFHSNQLEFNFYYEALTKAIEEAIKLI